ncbi:hypothetical protein GGR43_002740 [Sphingobium jiangsuense]|uniref:Uncharacterized protein n=1 Tax=Sphingobium jiangsuense TaxID=870476 RepID=A0A7W6BL11_9SPHN|nr:hypothetical protein [Sphingobium jiangsuense]MBB3927017.1 hypothetical protein [Sphingobium jiangsuense]
MKLDMGGFITLLLLPPSARERRGPARISCSILMASKGKYSLLSAG